MEITFNPAKDVINRDKHGCSLGLARDLDWDSVIATRDRRRDYGEPREIGYGLLGNRVYCVVFVRRGEAFHIISFRKANRREVHRYVQQPQDRDAD